MATQRQIEANRKNAKKSTGPRTEKGKAVSRLNALQSGIDAKLDVITGENEDSLEDLAASFYHDHQPANSIECSVLDGIIRDTWLLRRFFHIEAELLEYEMESDLYKDRTEHKLGKAFLLSSGHQIRLQRRIIPPQIPNQRHPRTGAPPGRAPCPSPCSTTPAPVRTPRRNFLTRNAKPANWLRICSNRSSLLLSSIYKEHR